MSEPKQESAKKPAAKVTWSPREDLLPTVPEGYKPVGKVVVVSESADGSVRVVSDTRHVWKEAAE